MTRFRSSIVVVLTVSALLAGAVGVSLAAEKAVTVGGAPMYPSKNIVQNASNSKDHTTLVTAVQAGGLVETLSGPGPFTVFAPTNAAFDKLPPGTVDNLLKPEKKPDLTKILTYHVIAEKLSEAELKKWAKVSGNKLTLKTVQGEDLAISLDGNKMYVTDQSGNRSQITIADVNQKNGVIHVVDTVLLPK